MTNPSTVKNSYDEWCQTHRGYKAFEKWIDVYAQELSNLSALSDDTKKKMALILLDYLSIAHEDWISQHALLRDASETASHLAGIHWYRRPNRIAMKSSSFRAGMSLLTDIFSQSNPWVAPDLLNSRISEKINEVFRAGNYCTAPLNLDFDKGVSQIKVDTIIGKRVSWFRHSYARVSLEVDVGSFVEPKVGFRDKVQWGHIGIGEPIYNGCTQKHTVVPVNMEEFLLSQKALFVLEKKHTNVWDAEGVISAIIKKLNDFRRLLEKEVYAMQYAFYDKKKFEYYDFGCWHEKYHWKWNNLF